jgi:hypothetical protein
MSYMFGVLENVDEKQSQRGEAYWSVTISGRRYTAWDQSLVDGVRPGDHVAFSYVQSGPYRKLVALSKTTTERFTRWLSHHQEKGIHITRLSCLRTAAQVTDGRSTSSLRNADIVLRVARLFEDHVRGVQGADATSKKVRQ